ncbi:MAG: hypothetical protein ABI837_02665 [Acidobacteriota bacterium]
MTRRNESSKTVSQPKASAPETDRIADARVILFAKGPSKLGRKNIARAVHEVVTRKKQ